MQNVYIDFETYYDSEYSLKKMATVLYVRDPRYKTLGVSVAVEDETPQFLSHDELIAWAATIDWSQACAIAHKTLFDGLILAEHYSIFPARYVCTESMARALLPIDSVRLKRVSEVLGIGAKGDALVPGSDVVSQELIDYANNDVVLCRKIDQLLRPLMPARELDLLSLTLRWGCVGTLRLNSARLEVALDEATTARNAAIAASGYTEAELTSRPSFAKILRDLEVTVPIKTSARTGEDTEAFSQNDPEFIELMLAYPEHAALWAGRKAAASNIAVNRTEKLLQVSRLGDGTLPMQLNYYGAHTGRHSGAGGLNVQNLPNGSATRTAIEAPPGYVICVVDSSQIELRTNMWFCGQLDRLAAIVAGRDPYIEEAAEQYHIPYEEVSKDQRRFGKAAQLGLGFGMAHVKFRRYCASGPLGMAPIYISDEESWRGVNSYRTRHNCVVTMWRILTDALAAMMMPNCDIEIGPVRLQHESVLLPNGMTLDYSGLRPNEQGGFSYGVDKKTRYIYGSKFLENIIQAFARVIVMEQILTIDERYPTQSSTHDEAIYLAPEAEADEALAFGLKVFSTTPSCAPGLTLAAEGGYAHNYSK
jgi:DNA polymerase bacteriophage-type